MKKKIALSAGAAVSAFLLAGFIVADSTYLGINRGLQIFGEVFRQVSLQYVDDVDPVKFIEAGIDGMLDYLDPYTTYIPEERSDDVEMLTNGRYGGFGITVETRDQRTYIMGLAEGFAADRAGVKVGDILIGIDSVNVQGLTSGELRTYTRGKPGLPAKLTLLRGEKLDTVVVGLEREDIVIRNVPYSGFLAPGIGYIKLERFSRTAPTEVRNALSDLRIKGQMSGLVLDLRDNPGGLLEAAIAISEMFIPEKTLVVSTRGRDKQVERSFYSRTVPLEPDLPLAVLINERSASASEIVAGAIQDNDRGVLVGQRSFGKGLVQTIAPLPYNSSLKITTARYFTPSGRSIQKVDYYSRRNKDIVTLPERPSEFYTRNGRIVAEGDGIAPDTFVSNSTGNDIIRTLDEKLLLFRFASIVAQREEGIHEGFAVTPDLLQSFYEFIKKNDAEWGNSTLAEAHQLRSHLKEQGYSDKLIKKMEEIESTMKEEQRQAILKGDKDIASILEQEIMRCYLPQSKFIAYSINNGDKQIATAKQLLRNPKEYAAITRTTAAAKE